MMPIDLQSQTQSGPGPALQAATRVAVPGAQPATAPSAPVHAPPTSAAVVSAAKQIESYLRRSDSSLEFQVDSATGQTVVTVRNTATGDVVRQIPNEEVLRIAQRIDVENSTVLNLHV